MNEGVNRRQLILALCLLCSMILLLFINPQLLIVPCFLLVWLLPRIVTTKYSGAYATSNASKVSKKKLFVFLALITLAAGELTEIFAILSNLNLPPEERILFLPDPFLDLIVSFAYYISVFSWLHTHTSCIF
ncbi:MAG: hypothetical protein J7L47_02865 [Candidatus Odinarchaeota archaeon]|nr:hypothetical protein [Candidatus Odinarchaeota archaeon]